MFTDGKVQRHVDLVDLEKYCKMRIWTQNSASIQPRTSPLKLEAREGRLNGSRVPQQGLKWAVHTFIYLRTSYLRGYADDQ